MNTATEPVLEILAQSGDWRSASEIIVNINEQFADPPSKSTVYRALEDLESYEYVGDFETTELQLIQQKKFERYGTYYRITDLGRAFLEGNIDGGAFEDNE